MYAHNAADFTPEMFEEFLEGSLEWIAEAQSQLVHIESGKDFDPEITVNMLFRQLHTLKGTAPFFGLLQTKNLAHALENLLEKIRDDGLEFSGEITAVLLSGLGVLFETCENSCEEGKEVCDSEQLKAVLNDLTDIVAPKGEINAELYPLVQLLDPFVNEVITSGRRDVLNLIQFSSLSSAASTLAALTLDPLTHLGHFAKSLSEFKSAVPSDFAMLDEFEKLEKELSLLLHPKSDKKRGFRVTGRYYFGDICVSPELSITYDVISAPISKITKGTFERVNEALIQLSEKLSGDALVVCQKMADLVFLLVSGIEHYSETLQVELNDILQELLAHITIEDSPSPEGDEESEARDPTARVVSKTDGDDGKKVSGTLKIRRTNMDQFVSMIAALGNTMNEEALNNPRKNQGQPGSDDLSDDLEDASFDSASLLRDQLAQLLSTPLEDLTKKIPVLVRSVCESLDQSGVKKKIKVSVDCKDITVSEETFQLLEAPITHIIRNACDHGIESCEERVAAGKPEEGSITIMADSHNERIRLMIQDDGAGINIAKVKEKAVSKGLITESEASRISDDAAVELLFLPGFSTAEIVSDISGRGVGLDVVKSDITKAGGKFFIKNMPGVGIVFIIKLPAFKSLFSDCRAVMSDNQSFLVPLEFITSIVPVTECYVNDKDRDLTWHNKHIPFTRLKDVFCTGRSVRYAKPASVIFIDYNEEERAIIVDQIGPKVSVNNDVIERRGQEIGTLGTVKLFEKNYSLLDLSHLKDL